MTPINQWSDAQLRRLYREVMAQGDPFAKAGEKSPHAHKSREELIAELDAADIELRTADEVMGDMNVQIDDLILTRAAWAVFAVVEAVVLAGLLGKYWDVVR